VVERALDDLAPEVLGRRGADEIVDVVPTTS